MLSVTLIFEAFKHIAKGPFLSMECFLGNYIFCINSPWLLTWYTTKWVTLGKRVAIGGVSLKGHRTIPHSYLPLFALLPFCFLIFWVFGCIDPRKGLYLISWEEGAKGLEVMLLTSYINARPIVLRAMKCFSE
jgi:hypothetical protein